jgi:hypothetical protein
MRNYPSLAGAAEEREGVIVLTFSPKIARFGKAYRVVNQQTVVTAAIGKNVLAMRTATAGDTAKYLTT